MNLREDLDQASRAALDVVNRETGSVRGWFAAHRAYLVGALVLAAVLVAAAYII